MRQYRYRADSVAARMYDLLTTHDRWMSVHNMCDWLDLDRLTVQQAINRTPDGDLWTVREHPDTSERLYRAVDDRWHRIVPQTDRSCPHCEGPKSRHASSCWQCHKTNRREQERSHEDPAHTTRRP